MSQIIRAWTHVVGRTRHEQRFGTWAERYAKDLFVVRLDGLHGPHSVLVPRIPTRTRVSHGLSENTVSGNVHHQ